MTHTHLNIILGLALNLNNFRSQYLKISYFFLFLFSYVLE